MASAECIRRASQAGIQRRTQDSTVKTGRVTRGELLRYRLPMAKPECPICHAQPTSAGKLRYCAHCGWQKKQTETQLRLNLKMVPIAFAVMVLILAFMFFRSGARTQNPWLIGLFFSFPLIALAVSYAVTKRNLKALLAQPPADASPGAGTASFGTDATVPALSPQYEALLNTPPPRNLRMSRRGKFNLTLPLLV